MNRMITFPRRIPEPKQMEKLELDIFEEFSGDNYKHWFIPLVDDALVKARLTTGRILDVGCGPGFLVKECASRSKEFKVVGLDISSYAIKIARENCDKLHNVSIKKGSVYEIPFKNRSFDLVLCKDSLHHFDNTKKALREMVRVLKKNGVLYIQDLRRDLPKYLLKQSIPPDTVLKQLQFYSTRASYTKNELKKILKDLCFKHYGVRTRILTHSIKQYYKKRGINISQLRESFQARYIAIIKP